MWIAESYAKINLGLRVLERLPTGYHTIETGFVFLEWSDRFEVTPAGEYRLELSDESIPTDESNLITRAYRAFETYVGLQQAYKIAVTKRIPAGAGLGGGSSNAALTFRMLNKMEKAGLSDEEIVDLCRDLGADIPFFVMGKTGIGSGLGGDIEPLDIQPNAWIVTVYPGFESSTADAYRYCEPNPDTNGEVKSILLNEPPDEWRYLLQNDLEGPVVQKHHLIGDMKDQLYDFGADYAAMTGSGSSVFGLFEQDFVAINAYESFHKLGFSANLTRPGFSPDYGIYIKDN
ncbi:MAG: 4-(cytidine 5'-diphospho)-2-C-methyl-D-erythritol kinase [Balneolaceae bacterium]